MKRSRRASSGWAIFILLARVASAQHEHPIGLSHREDSMLGALGPWLASREASGTSWIPESSPMYGLHFDADEWQVMTHGFATLVWDDQGGKRGDQLLFSTNMLMISASRRSGPDALTFRTMFSLEPATVGQDGYPLLFQTGETGNGKTPLVDEQHPHDLFMELAGIYSRALASDRSVFAYIGLPGEPALGPPTFMHRFSGMEIPEAPLSHHWLDSTHISYGVLTIGGIWGPFKLDASAFNGREPDEHRWDIELEALDSAAVRLSCNPTENWSFQVSVGELREPEQLAPDVDTVRSTASVIYNSKWDEDNWQTTLAVGRNDDDPGESSHAFLLESALSFAHTNTWLARFERVDKAELFSGTHPLSGSEFTIDKLSLGYQRELAVLGNVSLAAGVLGSLYWFESALDPFYGNDPRSFMLFLRGRL